MDYTSLAAEALGSLQDAGFSMTLRRTTAGTFSPGGGTLSGGSTDDYIVTGLDQAPTMSQGGGTGERFFSGVMVQADDRFLLLAAFGMEIVPAPGDLLIIDGVSYTIMAVIPVRPGGVDLLYRVLARK